MTRLATPQDLAPIQQHAVTTLKLAAAVVADRIGPETLANLPDRLADDRVVIVVTNNASAFIECERHEDGRWQVIKLMPMDMHREVGLPLIAAAFAEEHKRRPFKPDVECFARLDLRSDVEQNTAKMYTGILGTNVRDVKDLKGTVRATEIFLPAGDVAAKLGVNL